LEFTGRLFEIGGWVKWKIEILIGGNKMTELSAEQQAALDKKLYAEKYQPKNFNGKNRKERRHPKLLKQRGSNYTPPKDRGKK
jgi:hypothetical protein